MIALALIYAEGKAGFKQDFSEALTWLRKAADLKFVGLKPDVAHLEAKYVRVLSLSFCSPSA